MNSAQLNLLCGAYQNVDKMSLHTGDPGSNGANDSGITKATLSWGTPVDGVMSATATFASVPAGNYPYVGLWDGAVFIEGFAFNVVTSQTIPLYVTVQHHAKERV
jgi:hypothetical protein